MTAGTFDRRKTEGRQRLKYQDSLSAWISRDKNPESRQWWWCEMANYARLHLSVRHTMMMKSQEKPRRNFDWNISRSRLVNNIAVIIIQGRHGGRKDNEKLSWSVGAVRIWAFAHSRPLPHISGKSSGRIWVNKFNNYGNGNAIIGNAYIIVIIYYYHDIPKTPDN